jgi:hypothetical protein
MNDSQRQRLRALLESHPDRVPIVIETNPPLVQPTRSKLLVPDTYTVAQTIITLRRFMPTLKPCQAIFVMVEGGVLAPNTASVSSLYNTYANEDGVLKLIVTCENAFG